MADSFYRYNYFAVLLGSGKYAVSTAFSLYRRYKMKIIVVDEFFGIIKFLPFCKCYSSSGINRDEFLVSYLSSFAEHFPDMTPILFVSDEKYIDFFQSNKTALSETFITNPNIIFK